MDERVFAEDYVRIWMTSATVTEVVHRVVGELGFPLSAGEVLLMAQRIRGDGTCLPVRPGEACLPPLTLVPQPDGDYLDNHGRSAYRVGPGTPVEGPWACTRCRAPMCGGFIVLPTELDEYWPVCEDCVALAD
jgi:hypothetical protein